MKKCDFCKTRRIRHKLDDYNLCNKCSLRYTKKIRKQAMSLTEDNL